METARASRIIMAKRSSPFFPRMYATVIALAVVVFSSVVVDCSEVKGMHAHGVTK